jgi:hypothetical protein
MLAQVYISIDKSLICREQAGYYDLAVALVLWLGTLDASLSARTTGWYAEGNLAMARA